MIVPFTYNGSSGVSGGVSGPAVVALAPNLAREAVAFDAPLARPLRFREAVSALHDVVISDLRFKKRDRTAYHEWKKNEEAHRAETRRRRRQRLLEEALAAKGRGVAPDLERRFVATVQRYWSARRTLASDLLSSDRELWRMLMPCDPIVTVAEDAALFECFSADESSYGCLSLARDGGLGKAALDRPGTTNVDYSWELYRHFQSLRSYRETRLTLDPGGLGVATSGAGPSHREEKIDLPAGWLRALGQLQGAMTLPARAVPLSREAVYAILAVLRRRRARTSPRALRFELQPGRAPRVVIEPWEVAVDSHATRYEGPPGKPVRIWGRNRLLALARTLPLAERFDVRLLGTGLPSFWVARMGEMSLTLGLSGWTSNDWAKGSVMDLLAPSAPPSKEAISSVERALAARGSATADALAADLPGQSRGSVLMSLHHLARTGQAIHDLPAGVFRRRSILPRAIGEADIGEEPVETRLAQQIAREGKVRIERRDEAPGGGRVLVGKVDGAPVEALLDADGVLVKGTCRCSHHFRSGVRKGPCRHLGALRIVDAGLAPDRVDAGAEAWYERVSRWAAGS